MAAALACLVPAARGLGLQNAWFKVQADPAAFSLTVSEAGGKALLRSTGTSGIRYAKVTGLTDPFGLQFPDWKSAPAVVASRASADSLHLELASAAGQPAAVAVDLGFAAPKALRVRIRALDTAAANRVEIRFAQAPADRFYGLGERSQGAEHHGKSVYCWAEEGTSKTEATWFPVPYFFSLPGNYGFLVDDTHYAEFDFGKSAATELKITNWNHDLDFLVFTGADPLEVLEDYTAYAGRATMLPKPWVFGTWNTASSGNKGKSPDGKSRTYAVMDELRQGGIPASAMWNDDWDLGYGFDYPSMVGKMHQQGFKALGYRFPYQLLSPGNDLVTLCGGNACATLGGVMAQPDLTIPAGRKWEEDNGLNAYFQTGGDGWMHDFGEYTPATSWSHDGRDGWAVHNDYPRLWAQTGREFWDAKRPGGDWAFFMRSGWTGSWKYAPVAWAGDQTTDWGAKGIPCVPSSVLSLSLSGFPVVTCDIGAYICLLVPPADRELFYRSTQMGALMPVMREHNGYYACGQNFLFDTDSASLAHWKKYAVLHTRLFPYIYTLAQQAKDHGWPIIRHLILHYPGEAVPEVRQNDEWLLGDRILVAPVIAKGAISRDVYLPSGSWVHWWTGQVYAGGKQITVPAPLEEIPIFVKAGTVLPTFDLPVIHTLVDTSLPGVNGFKQANASMALKIYGRANDDLTLWDGTRISCRDGKCTVAGGPARTYSFESIAPDVVGWAPMRGRAAESPRAWMAYDVRGRFLARLPAGAETSAPLGTRILRPVLADGALGAPRLLPPR